MRLAALAARAALGSGPPVAASVCGLALFNPAQNASRAAANKLAAAAAARGHRFTKGAKWAH